MDLSTKKQQLGERLQNILATAEEAGRPLTDAELRDFDAAYAELERIDATAGAAAKMDALRQPRPRVTQPDQPYRSDGPRSSPAPWPPSPTGWIDGRTGQALRVFGRGEPFATPRSDLSVGRYLRGLVTGSWHGADAEQALMRNAMSTTAGGSYLVPEELSRRVIDLARANSVLIAAGVPSVPMASDAMFIAKLAGDPQFEVKSENAAFTPSQPTFSGGNLIARTLGCLVTASRELAEDAPNFPSLIEDILGRALGVELDRLSLVGNGGSDGVLGLVNSTQPELGGTGSVGPIAWEDFHAAVVGVRENNYTPNAILVHPTILGDAQILTSGNGTDSAKLWLGSPPSLADVPFMQSTSLTTAYAIAGDFANGAIFGFRTGATVEATTTGGDAFAKHQLLVKITQRFGFLVLRGGAFHVLSGITT